MAAAATPDDDKILAMYERVARNGGDHELLLDFLERRAALPSATPQQIREAVDARRSSSAHDERAEALLVRAVAAARDTADGLGSAPWAVLALAERRLAANDLTQARDLTYEIAPIAEAEAVDGLAMRIATRALAHRKVDLAADVYEFLRERNPADRAVWQPLLTIYRELGDGDRLGSVISSTLPALVTAGERNALRLEHAQFLIENLKRHHDALDVLRDALSDDPDNLEAAELLRVDAAEPRRRRRHRRVLVVAVRGRAAARPPRLDRRRRAPPRRPAREDRARPTRSASIAPR